MRKAFSNEKSILEIKPIYELPDMPLIPEGITPVEKINYKHDEVFVNKTKNNIKLSIIKEDENELVSEKQVNQDVENHAESIEEKPVKKGIPIKDKDPIKSII